MRILKDEKILRMVKKSPSTGIDLLIETYGSLVGYIVRHKLSSVCSEEDVEEFTSADYMLQGNMEFDLRK